ncbi:hypothetical protein ACLM5J_14710 [Nocardioides sp. Bht2]|uniref:hypothetical protein n=1 Tax=Nocardioides sp. Bht2 TaxID=3392297 RepID=UPI0039B42479
MPSPPSSAQLALTRRWMIGGIAAAVAGVTVSGCEWGPDDDSSSDGSAANQNSARTGTDPDDALVDQAVTDLLAAQAIAAQAARRAPAAARRLRVLQTGYVAQLELLGSARPDAAETTPAGDATVAAALTRARAVQGTMTGYAGEAASGDLARAFAAIAAGIAQALASSGDTR